MTGELPPKKKTQLALAIAQGASVSAWARANQVSVRTAFRWASDPKVRAAAESCRRRAVDRAIGRMAMRTTWAADQIAKLGGSASSDSVKLAALRAILSDMMKINEYAGLEVRMTEIEEQLRDRTDNTGRTG